MLCQLLHFPSPLVKSDVRIARMIATVDDLEAIALSDRAEVPALSGWRRKLFGDRALELKHGRLALTVENGKVVTLEWKDAEAPNPAA